VNKICIHGEQISINIYLETLLYKIQIKENIKKKKENERKMIKATEWAANWSMGSILLPQIDQ
jgi:hypothetical protein